MTKALAVIIAIVSLLGGTLRATPLAGFAPAVERSEITRSAPEERDPALQRQRDVGRVTSLRAASRGDGGSAGRARDASAIVFVPVPATSIVARAPLGESRAIVAQRSAAPRARTRAELMVFLN